MLGQEQSKSYVVLMLWKMSLRVSKKTLLNQQAHIKIGRPRRLPVAALGNQKFSFKPNWMLRRSGGGVVMGLGGMMPLKAWIPVTPGALRSRFPVLM